jgi:uncharacterized protein
LHLRYVTSSPRAGASVLVVFLLLAVAALAGCQPPGGENRLSIATGGSGGVYNVYGGGLADQISENLDGYIATAETTSASVDNMYFVADGKSDIGFSLADTAADGVNGEGVFDEPLPAQALAQLYINYTQVVTTEDAGIETVEDLADRSVSVGDPGSGTEVVALRVLDAAGIDPENDIGREQLSVSESVEAIRDRNIDAFFWSGGLPTGAIVDLATTDNVKLLPTLDYLDELQQRYGGEIYQEAEIPGDVYEGVEGVPTIGVPNYLVVNEDMDEELAYRLTRLLFERQEQLEAVHEEAANLDFDTAQEVSPLELHPGARRYYEEED